MTTSTVAVESQSPESPVAQAPAATSVPASEAETKQLVLPVVLTDGERVAITAAEKSGKTAFRLTEPRHETNRFCAGETKEGHTLFVHIGEHVHLRVDRGDISTGPALCAEPNRSRTIPALGTWCIAAEVAAPLAGGKNPRAMKFATLANYMAATAYLATAHKEWEGEKARRAAQAETDRKAQAERIAAKQAAEEAVKARRAEVAAQLCESAVDGVNGGVLPVVALQVVHVNAEKNFAIAVNAANEEYLLNGREQGSLVLDSSSRKVKLLYRPAAGATLPQKGEVVYAPEEGIRAGNPRPVCEGWMKRDACLEQVKRLQPAAQKAAETLAKTAAEIAEAEAKRRADIAHVAATHRQPKSGSGEDHGGWGNSKKSRNARNKRAKRDGSSRR